LGHPVVDKDYYIWAEPRTQMGSGVLWAWKKPTYFKHIFMSFSHVWDKRLRIASNETESNKTKERQKMGW